MIPLGDTALWNAANTFAGQQRRQWNGEMPDDELREHQRSRRVETVEYCRERSPFYRAHLNGLSAAEPFESLPFTTKQDLRTHLDDVASLPLGEAWVYYETTGTTGISTPCPRSAEDSMRTGVALCEGYRDLLARHGEHLTIAVMGPTEVHSTGDTFGDVLRSLGHATVKMWPHSPVVGFGRAVELLERLPVDGLTCTPGMAIMLARHLTERGLRPRDLGIKVVLTLGELATPPLLEQIGRVWGAEVHSCMYASQEASILAVCRSDGALRTTPLNYYYEVVDPETGAVLDESLAEREGELVVTHLYQGAKPMVRYRTGDLVRAVGGGQDFVVVPIGRARDALRIAGRPYTAFDFEQAVLDGCPPFLDYQVGIHEIDGTDAIDVRFEPEHGADEVDAEISDRYARQVSGRFGVPVTVTWGATDARTSTGAMVSWKAARIRDHREADAGLETDSSRKIGDQRLARVP